MKNDSNNNHVKIFNPHKIVQYDNELPDKDREDVTGTNDILVFKVKEPNGH